jgi:hypothetical protein
MPTFSNNSIGTYTYTVPAGATNLEFSFAAGGGGGSRPTNNNWNITNGANGRAGTFRIATRSYAYNLTFYLGSRGNDGLNNQGSGVGSGGSGGSSPVAGGGSGHRSGGGGGGASAVYDGGVNRYIAWCGGGGGAGRFHPSTGQSFPGAAGAGIGGGRTSNQGGGPSWRGGGSAPFGHRGGGGGGSVLGVFGGLGGTTTSSGYSGIGGNSGWWDQGDIDWNDNSGYGNQGNGWMILTYTNPPPEILYFLFNYNGSQSSTVNIIEGEQVDIDWAVNGSRSMSSITLNPTIGSISTSTTSNSYTVTPTYTGTGNIGTVTYTLTVTGPGGTVSQSITATVYQQPSVTISSSFNNINYNSSVQLEWTTTGFASTAQLSPNLGTQNTNGQITIFPTETTTYIISVGGLAGSDSDQVTVVVNQPPDSDLIVPSRVNYGEDIVVGYDYTNATGDVVLKMQKDGGGYTQIATLPTGDVVGNLIVPASDLYDDTGARQVEFELIVTGAGSLQGQSYAIVVIDIDELPDSISIPSSVGLFIDQSPVITPDATITSSDLVVTDIDIPVEIKASSPIQVEIDDDGTWRDIRSI